MPTNQLVLETRVKENSGVDPRQSIRVPLSAFLDRFHYQYVCKRSHLVAAGTTSDLSNPALDTSYRRMIRYWLIFANLPWAVMGIGIVFGGVPSVFHYFNARNGPFVIAFYVSVVTVWILMFYYLFFRRGAEELIEHPGLLNFPVQKPIVIKTFFLISLAGGIVALTLMILGKLGTPTLGSR